MPGGRLKLDTRDLYAHRGGIDERWFSSATKAANGPGTPVGEGLSYIAIDGKRVLLQEAVDTLGDGSGRTAISGPRCMRQRKQGTSATEVVGAACSLAPAVPSPLPATAA